MPEARFDLTDEEWTIFEPLLPPQERGPERKDDRKILDGIFYILRTGTPWRDLPERYGPQTTVYNRYNRWGLRGVWCDIFEAFAQECEDALVFVDASIVKAHRAAAGSQKRGAGRRYWSLTRGRTSKVHAGVDAKGRPLRLAVSGGQLHDSQMIEAFLDWSIPPLAIVADKAYGSKKIRQQIADEGALAVIPAKSNERHPVRHDPDIYVQRNLVERFFCKMKDMRRLAMRFEKTTRNFLLML